MKQGQTDWEEVMTKVPVHDTAQYISWMPAVQYTVPVRVPLLVHHLQQKLVTASRIFIWSLTTHNPWFDQRLIIICILHVVPVTFLLAVVNKGDDSVQRNVERKDSHRSTLVMDTSHHHHGLFCFSFPQRFSPNC